MPPYLEGPESRQYVQERVSGDQEEPYVQPYRLVRNSVISKLTMGPCHLNDKKFSFIIVIKQNFLAFFI